MRNGHQSSEKSLSWLWRQPCVDPGAVWLPWTGKGGRWACWGFMCTDIYTHVNFPRVFQLTPEFSQRLCCKIHELLSVIENGLKSADPRDCTSYTGWAGEKDPYFPRINCCWCCHDICWHEICVSCNSCLVLSLFYTANTYVTQVFIN